MRIDKGLIVMVLGVVCLISLGGFLLNSTTSSNQTLAQAPAACCR